ncbi:MAG: 2-oxo acid dehydrogenase subunit E2, partial [Salinisphaera sp.]|nr:2-oxo acid dehydrogenase subunit E2 [Salinisphaera sp.]
MSIEIKVPELPESVAEASVGAWYTSQGDQVERDQNLVDLETDKVMLEVPAIASGVLTEIRAQAGATVQAGDVLGILEEGEAAGEPSTEPAGAASPSQQSAPAADRGAQEQREETQSGGVPEPSPAARKLMEENDLTPDSVPGSGKDGRITKADVQNALAAQGPAPSRGDDGPVVPVQKPEAEEPLDASELADRAALAAGNKRLEQRVPMTRIRARIAERLLQASQNTAMLTTFNEINMHAVTQARVQYKEEFEKHHGVRLGFMSFFVKAAIEALKRFPIVNASIDDQDIVYHGYYDIGIAVSSPRGLLVPILRDADQLSYAEIEDAVHD